MKKTILLWLAAATLLVFVGFNNTIWSGTNYQGAINQPTNTAQLGGNAIAVGAGSSNTGTQRVILSADSPAGNVGQTGSYTVTPGTGTWNINGVNGSIPVSISSAVSTTLITVISTAVAGPIVSTQAVTTAANPTVNANLTRKGIECEADSANTDLIYINFGKVAAAATGWPMAPASSWQPPPGVTVGAFISAIAATGTQAMRCVEYP